jgi:serine/threonine-protein kinase
VETILQRSVESLTGPHPVDAAALREHWSTDTKDVLEGPDAVAAGSLGRALAARTQLDRLDDEVAALCDQRGTGDGAAIVLTWVESMSAREELWLVPILTHLQARAELRELWTRAALARARWGPRREALRSLALVDSKRWIRRREARTLAARIDLLVWFAAEQAERHPDLGRWLLRDKRALRHLVFDRARGTSRERSLAARLLAIAAVDGPMKLPAARGVELAATLEQLAGHPDPEVWIHAVRAMGRLAAIEPALLGVMQRMRVDERLRRRATTAIACLPADAPIAVTRELRALFASNDPWMLAALGPAIPHLAAEHREVWDSLIERVSGDDARLEVLFSVAQGLATLARGGDRRAEALCQRTAARAREQTPRSSADAMLRASILRASDQGRATIDADDATVASIDGELVVARAVELAQTPEGFGAARALARRAAAMLPHQFEQSWTTAIEASDHTTRGSALTAAESAVRALAQNLGELIEALDDESNAPLLPDIALPDIALPNIALPNIARRARAYLDRDGWDFAMARSAFRILGHAFDANGASAATLLDAVVAQEPDHTQADRSPPDRSPPDRSPPDRSPPDRSQPDRTQPDRTQPDRTAGLSPRRSSRARSHKHERHALVSRVLDVVGPELSDEERFARLAAWWRITGRSDEVLEAAATWVGGRSRAFTLAASTSLSELLASATDPSARRALALHLEALVAGVHAGGTRLHQALSLLASALVDCDAALATPTLTAIEQCLETLSRVLGLLRQVIQDPVFGLRPHRGRGHRLQSDHVLVARTLRLAELSRADTTPARRRPAAVEEAGPRVGASRPDTSEASSADESIADESIVDESIMEEWSRGLGPPAGAAVRTAVIDLMDGLGRVSSSSAHARGDTKRFGRFETIRKLGSSGMGDVWLVHDPDSGDARVIKTVRGALADASGAHREWLERALVNEASTMLAIRHPNVVRIFGCDFGTQPPYVVMEYLAGCDLEHLRMRRRLTLDELKPIVRDVCRGLTELHAHGVVHRDVKPSNVFLRMEDGDDPRSPIKEAVVIDFGTAWQWNPMRAAESPMVCGTFGYLPPEAVWNQHPGPKSDVYSLAATLYYAIVGHGFFPRAAEADDPQAAFLYLHASEEPLASEHAVAGLSPGLASLLRAATRLVPEQRPSIGVFIGELERL